MSSCRTASLSQNRCRCCASESVFPTVQRGRRSLRHASKAEQKRAAEAKFPASMHRIGALLDPSMILFQAIIEVCVGSMEHLVAQCAHALLVGRRRGRPSSPGPRVWPTTARACADQTVGPPPYPVSRGERESTRWPSVSMARER
jgi:hypothetical protein